MLWLAMTASIVGFANAASYSMRSEMAILENDTPTVKDIAGKQKKQSRVVLLSQMSPVCTRAALACSRRCDISRSDNLLFCTWQLLDAYTERYGDALLLEHALGRASMLSI